MATRITSTRNLVKQESIQWIRQQILKLTLVESRPNTKINVFFDKADVTKLCCPEGQAVGTPIYTDATGKASISFYMPGGRFNTGPREIVITEAPDLASLSMTGTTYVTARTIFNSSGTVEIFQTKEKKITIEERITHVKTQDPLAQSFFTYGVTGGAFLSQIDLFFYSRDPVLPVKIEIRAMDNGYPAKLEPQNEHHVQIVEATSVTTSTNASAATKFVFDPPIYLREDSDYCFVVRSNSDKYQIFTSKMGEKSMEDQNIISQQPYVGSLFKSENNITWTAEQFEDIKFTLNKAVFSTAPASVTMKVEYPIVNTPSTYFSTVSGQNTVTYKGVHDHGLEVGSKIVIQTATDLTFNGIPSSQFNATKTVTSVPSRKSLTFTTTSSATATGTISSGGKLNQLFIAEGGENYSLSDSISIIGGGGTGATASMVLTDGVITGVTITNAGSGYTADPYVVVNTSTGTGAQIIANVRPYIGVQTNKPMSVLTADVPVYNYSTSSTDLSLTTTLGNYAGGSLTTYTPGTTLKIKPNGTYQLNNASLIANPANETAFMSGTSSSILTLTMSTNNPNVAPILNTAVDSILTADFANVNMQNGETITSTNSSGAVTGYVITSGGQSYTQNPIVTISPPDIAGGVQATATASKGAGSTLISVTITNGGSGYLSTPTAVISRGAGDTTGNGAAVQFSLQKFNSELLPTGGTAVSKYVSTKIQLEIPSTGARLYANITSIPTTSVDWYIRTSMSTSTEVHETKGWTRMSCNLDRNRSNYIGEYFEYEFRADNLPTYDTYDLKCVFRAQNPVQVPAVSSYRVICVA